ncbi:MAG: glycosyltransferase family 2 protein [Chloroflexi bacterium]|nr:glycosyltransferase family 2 protein [Chloroflexota bacterium]
MTQQPRVTLGLPVYNGESHLSYALDAILAQTYQDFVLIISDNASTDRTQEICLAYAAKAPRIHYYRNAVNLGAAQNFNRVFELSSSEYFMWASHDDIMQPTLLAQCVARLDQDPTVVLCHCLVNIIDDQGQVMTAYDDALTLHNVGSARPSERFKDLIMIPHYCFDGYGLIRASALTMRPIFEGHVGSDRNFLAELGLLGKFQHVPEYLFLNRDHIRRHWPLWKWVAQFDTARVQQIPYPRWSLFGGYLRSVQRAPLSRGERLRCYLLIAAWIPRNVRGLAKDLLVAAALFLKRLVSSVKQPTHLSQSWS